MFFKTNFNDKVSDKYKEISQLGEDDFGPEDEGFYLTGDLDEKTILKLDKVLGMTDKQLLSARGIFKPSAEIAGRTCGDFTLRKAQVRPVILSYLNPRFFIGDSPGLGKTVMSAGAYSFYRLQQYHKGEDWGKVLVVTDSIHVIKFSQEWASFGVNIFPFIGNRKNTLLKKEEYLNTEEWDGLITNWDALKTNDFNEYWLEYGHQYDMVIYDETSRLLNPKAKTTIAANAIVNVYNGGVERVIFLNGTSFEKNIYDYYHQFQILKPKLIPSKSFLDARYVIKEGSEIMTRGHDASGRMRLIKTRIGKISNYKNQEELKERLQYYFIARTKADFSDDLPQHTDTLHLLEMTAKQRKLLKTRKAVSLINSPATSGVGTLTRRNSPKLDYLLYLVQKTEEDRPVIYCYNQESQITIKEELEKLGYVVAILNGIPSAEEKNNILKEYNEHKSIDILVFNITKAMNVPTSDRLIFYDIPTMPSETKQIKARIDRDNYEDSKFYDFLCYADSPEMLNIVNLANTREYHSGRFSGQKDTTYKTLVDQLYSVYSSEALDEARDKIELMESENKEFKDISDEIASLLDIVGV